MSKVSVCISFTLLALLETASWEGNIINSTLYSYKSFGKTIETLGIWTVHQSSPTNLRSQNSVDPYCGQSQVMRDMEPSSLSRNRLLWFLGSSELGCLNCSEGILCIFAMDFIQSTVELHLAENMVGSPTCFPDNFGSHAEMLHYISTLIANM